MSSDDREVAPPAGRRLTRLLARWADAHRLDGRHAATIRRQIVGEPEVHSFDWWWRLLNPDGGVVFRGLDASSGREAPERPIRLPSTPAAVWPLGMSGTPAWLHDDAEFTPYLRLT